MKVDMLFSDGEVFVVTKPAGMLSQGHCDSKMPELWELMKFHHPNLRPVHRIDWFTSGIVLAANSREGRAYFARWWHSITKKVYLAVIESPAWEIRIVDSPLEGKSAVTGFEVLERSGALALVKCELIQNGRMHQIRRHLESIGFPIVGDRRYNGMEISVRTGQLLHAWQMRVRLPNENFGLGGWFEFQAPIPDDFKTFSFNWSRWDSGATLPVESWSVPEDWIRTK